MKTKKHVRKLIKASRYSLSVIIPAEIVDDMKFREKQKVVLYKDGSKIIIKDWKK